MRLACSIPSLIVLAMLLLAPLAAAEPAAPLRTHEGKVVDDAGRPVTLRGVNLGNWLVLEMWMLGLGDHASVRDQHEFELALAERFGDAERHRLMELYREHYITERDFEIVRSFGMNTVRLPFEYRLLEDDARPMTLRDDAWKWLDRAIDLAERHGMYVVLDLHGAPGRQSGMDHTGRRDHNRLWSDPEAQERTAWLWGQIARRYRDRPTVCAYDLVNEPWGGTREQLVALVDRIYDAVRAADDRKIIVIPGFYDGIDFYGRPEDHGWQNVMFTMHFYPGFFGNGEPKPWTHAEFIRYGLADWQKRMERLGVPLLVGEFNVVLHEAGGAEMMRRYFDFYADHGWPATMWSYKLLTRNGGIGGGIWGMVTNADPAPPLDPTAASLAEIERSFAGFSTMRYAIDEDLRYWLMTDEEPAPLDTLPSGPPKLREPPANDPLPPGWRATDVGGALPGGQAVAGEGVMTLYGGGADIWQTGDQFRFLHRTLPGEGDFELSARVLELTRTHPYAKAGVMVRAGVLPGAPTVLLSIFPDGGLQLAVRESPDAEMRAVAAAGAQVGKARLRLARRGDTIEASYQPDGGAWQVLGAATVEALRGEVEAGVVALSHDNAQLTTARYEDVHLTPLR